MKQKDSYDEIIKELKSLPEPDYEKHFNEKVQDDIHQNLLNFISTYKGKKQNKHTFKKVMIGFSGLATLLLIGVLAFSTFASKNLQMQNRQSAQQVKHSKNQSEFNPNTHLIKEQTFSSPLIAVSSISTLEQTVNQNYPSDTLVDLGSGIKADYFSGSGYFKYKWNEGRWTILIAGSGDRTKGAQVAKNVVAYLQTHFLPVPDEKGIIKFIQSASSSSFTFAQNTISRQVGHDVYTLNETGDPIKSLQTVINSTSKTNSSQYVIKKQNFASSSKAVNSLTATEQDFALTYPSGKKVDLGSGIQAIYYEGAGQYKYTWYEGRWTVIFVGRGNRTNGAQAVENIVSYLHTHYLPAPDQKGVIMMIQTGSSKMPTLTQNTISRQVGNKVYTLEQTGDPIKALQIIVKANKS